MERGRRPVQASIWHGPAEIPEGKGGGVSAPANLLFFETLLQEQGFVHVAGTDEVGRGCLAGPVVAAAVILPAGCQIAGLTDSKKLTSEQRQSLVPEIEGQALSFSIEAVSPSEIDRINILQASLQAMAQAVSALSPMPDALLVDGNQPVPLSIPQKSIVKGDSRSISIAAASVLAKVYRDRLMVRLDAEFPGYGFASHKGYATKMHREAIKRLGPCRVHRMTFRGVREFVGSEI